MGPWDSWWLPDSQGKAEQTWMCPQNGGLVARELEPGDGQSRDPASQFLALLQKSVDLIHYTLKRTQMSPLVFSYPQQFTNSEISKCHCSWLNFIMAYFDIKNFTIKYNNQNTETIIR